MRKKDDWSFLFKAVICVMALVIVFNNVFPLANSVNFFDISGGAINFLTGATGGVMDTVYNFLGIESAFSYVDEIYCFRVRFEVGERFGYGTRYADFIAKDYKNEWKMVYCNLDNATCNVHVIAGRRTYVIMAESDGESHQATMFVENTSMGIGHEKFSTYYDIKEVDFSNIRKLTYREYLAEVRKNPSITFYDYTYVPGIYG